MFRQSIGAVIVASVVVSGGWHLGGPAANSRSALRALPPYYMVMGKLVPNRLAEVVALQADIRDTVTGRTLAVVRLPKPYIYINSITGAADDKAFVLAGQSTTKQAHGRIAFFLLKLSPAHRKVTLMALPIPKLRASLIGGLNSDGSTNFQGLALSPNGTQLAMATDSITGTDWNCDVEVYSLTRRQVKAWRASRALIGMANGDPQAMSWAGSGTLAVNVGTNKQPGAVRVLNTTMAGGSLFADSHLAIQMTGHQGWNPTTGDGIVTLNGTKIVAGMWRFEKGQAILSQVDEFSIATGKTLQVLYPRVPYTEGVFWTNSSGSAVVISLQHQAHQYGVVGVVTGNRFTRLPGAPLLQGFAFAYDLAF
jgi:hypothetical protein